MINKIWKYISTHKIISVVVVVVLVVVGYFIYSKFGSSSTNTTYVLGKVQRGDLVVTVSGTGQVSTQSKVEIKPQTTGQTQTLGQITKVNVINGQHVKAGDVIAVLDGANALQALNQARSSVASAQANYDKSLNGSGIPNISSSLLSAQTSLQNALQNMSLKLQSDYYSVSNAVLLNTDPFFDNPLIVPKILIADVYFNNLFFETKVNNMRPVVGDALNALKIDAGKIQTSSDPVAVANDAIKQFSIVRDFFDDLTSLFTNYSVSVNTGAESTISTDKNIAATARGTANTAILDMVSALQTYQSAVNTLNQSKSSQNYDNISSRSQLDNALANLATAEQNYSSRIIIAPFDGQIGGLVAQVGQQVSSNDVLGTIITPQKVVNISLNEVDAAKVKTGDSVILSFDALPNLIVKGIVNYLDPLGTVSQGVVNYSVQIGLIDQNDQIKTGMTATAEITTDTKPNVLLVPSSAVVKKNSRITVLVPDEVIAKTASSSRVMQTASSVHSVSVTVGSSNETNTEVISGLNEGDVIVVRTISGTTNSTTNTTRNNASIFGGGIRTSGR